MSLGTALNLTLAGLKHTQKQIAVTASNITNADTPGYTQKSIQQNYLNMPDAVIPAGGKVIGVKNDFVEGLVIKDRSIYEMNAEINESLDLYQKRIGNVGDGNTISRSISDLNTHLISLTAGPSDSNLKQNVANTAIEISQQVRQLAGEIQSLRQDAEDKLSNSIAVINENLELIQTLNGQISIASNQSIGNQGDLEDQRLNALNTIAEYIDIEFYYTSDNQVRIFTGSGKQLLSGIPRLLSHKKNASLTSSIQYPADIDGIYVGGIDITEEIKGGKIAGYIHLRDEAYVEERDKLDALTVNLMDSLNAASNQGTSFPARNTVTGDTSGLSATDAITASGTIRIATVNRDGVIQSVANIDVSAATDIDDIVQAIDARSGITATINVNGQLEIVADNADHGIALNQNDAVINSDKGLSHFFGLNNIFGGTSSDNMYTSDYLVDNPGNFGSGALTMSGNVGDLGLFAGDSSTANAMSEALTLDKATFSAAGNFPAQASSIIDYSNAFIAGAATRASNSEIKANATRIAFETVKETFDNETGVNIDEETARLLDLESKFQASARVMQTIQELFETLITTVR